MSPGTAFFVRQVILAVLIAGAWIFRATRGHVPMVVRVLAALVPLSAATALYSSVWTISTSPILDWNACKLAPVVAMVRGNPHNYALYQDPKSGVMTAWIYGPVPALLTLPAALASRPTTQILIGVCINVLALLVPVAWLHLRVAGRGSRWFAMLVFLVFVWRVLDHESLRRAAFMINIDGATIGLATCAIALLIRRARWRAELTYAISVVCAVLACWCKQTALPFVLVPPLYLWLAEGRRAGLQYLAILVIAGVAISAAFIVSFGAGNMWFHMVTLPGSHGWQNDASEPATSGHAIVMLKAIQRLLEDLVPTLGMILVVALIDRYLVARPAAGGEAPRWRWNDWQAWRAWLRENPWVMLPATAVAFVPASLLGYVKVGGYLNNFSLTHAFVAMTATVLMILVYRRATAPIAVADPADVGAQSLPRGLGRAVLVAAVCAMVTWEWPEALLPPRKVTRMYELIRNTYDNDQEVIYAYAKRNPEVIYFPWNTLSTLLAEGKLYHFEWGINDRYAAPEHLRPTDDQIRAHLPKKIRYIAFGSKHQSETSMVLFPYARIRVADPELPNFTIYTQPGVGVPAEQTPRGTSP